MASVDTARRSKRRSFPSSCDAEILAFEAYLEQNMVSYDGVINIVPENTLFGLKLNNTPPIEGLRQPITLLQLLHG